MVRWLMGDLNAVGFERPLQLAPVLLPGALVVRWLCLDLNLILVGDDFARSRGVNVQRVRLVLFGVVSLLTGVVVSFCGPIGFIGMMVPHILRLLLGAEHRWLFWGSLLGGGVFLACCDWVARALIFPAEVPGGDHHGPARRPLLPLAPHPRPLQPVFSVTGHRAEDPASPVRRSAAGDAALSCDWPARRTRPTARGGPGRRRRSRRES